MIEHILIGIIVAFGLGALAVAAVRWKVNRDYDSGKNPFE